jgi:hypothetical protein
MEPATDDDSDHIEIPRLGYHLYVGIMRTVGRGDDGFCPSAPSGLGRALKL